MIISHKYKFIFIKSVKTAGTSLEIYLSKFCGENDILTPIPEKSDIHKARNYKGTWNILADIYSTRGYILKPNGNIRRLLKNIYKGNRYYSHIPALLIRNRVSSEIWNSYFKFCVERNPWDKVLSHYYMYKGNNGPIELDEYIASGKVHCFNYHKYTDLNDNVIVDKIIKYESLNQELQTVFDKLNIPFEGTLRERALSGYRKDKRPYQEILSNSQRELIENKFSNEIKLHSYKF